CMVEMLEIFAGKALVQLSQRWIRRWKPCDHVVGSKQQTVAWRVKQHRAAESCTVGGKISRRRVGKFDCKRIEIAADNTAAQTGCLNNNKLDALPWDGSLAAEEHERHPISRLLFVHCHRESVAEDEQVPDQSLESATQVGA